MIKFDITNRWTGAVQFTAEIDCAKDAPLSIRIGLAVKRGVKSGAVLRGADLRDANLRDADLSGANLRGADLRDANLSGADLSGANLRDADLSGANLRDAVLRGADLSGANLRDANLSVADLSDANLSDADLRDADLRDADLSGANLSGAVLRGADLSDANLSDADLRDADLSGADLRDANLSGADLRGVPQIENIHQRVYEAASGDGALEMGSWHTCATTHCRAGWVVMLAGDEGLTLERRIGTAAAAALIYIASDSTLERVPSWYGSNDAALADMKRLAEQESACANSGSDANV